MSKIMRALKETQEKAASSRNISFHHLERSRNAFPTEGTLADQIAHILHNRNHKSSNVRNLLISGIKRIENEISDFQREEVSALLWMKEVMEELENIERAALEQNSFADRDDLDIECLEDLIFIGRTKG